MIRICSRPTCQRAYPVFESERHWPGPDREGAASRLDPGLCPGCRAGMEPLSTLIGGRLPGEQAREPQAQPVELEDGGPVHW